VGLADLDQLTQVEIGSPLRHACCLLHGMRHDDDRVAGAQLIDQILDARRRNRVERRARLVHQNHFRLDRDGARDAQALLLTAGQPGPRPRQPVLHLRPQSGPLQAGADDLVQIGAAARQAVNARTVGHVLVDRLRKRIGFLEHHADARPQLGGILALVMDVTAVEQDRSGDTRSRNRLVHAVQAAQVGRLAAARRADHGQNLFTANVDAHVLERMLAAVVNVDVTAREDRIVDGHRANRAAALRALLAERRCSMHSATRLQIETAIGGGHARIGA
jgi:hypothetical protein